MKTRNTRKTLLLLVAALAIGLSLLAVTRGVMAQLSGAIFTSTADGQTVNANIYDSCEDVYLNGGPPPNAPCGAAGLPDGDYYFQVTDPSGMTLLSTDGIEDRRVTVTGGKITANLGTHVTGTGKCPGAISVQLMPFSQTPNPGNEHKVWMTPVGSYSPGNGVFGFLPSSSKTDNFKCQQDENPQPVIGGVKYYDLNTNGVKDPGEPTIAGWRIDVTLTPGGLVTTFTDAFGAWGLVVPSGTTYTACEVLPPATTYLQTGPNPGATTADTLATANASKCWAGTVGNDDTTDLNFGNVCLGAGGGKTLGFWSNRNGEAAMNDGGTNAPELALLGGLNLRDAGGANFDPATYASFRTWLLNATATNMAYMLSAQLAAMELNVEAGFVNGGALVYAPGAAGANAAGFITVNNLMAEANAELGLHGSTLAGSPFRAYQEALKNALDKANNNLNFVQLTPCPFTTPY